MKSLYLAKIGINGKDLKIKNIASVLQGHRQFVFHFTRKLLANIDDIPGKRKK